MKSLTKNWSIIRVLKFGIGLACILSFPKHEEYIILLAGVYFLILGFINRCPDDNCPT